MRLSLRPDQIAGLLSLLAAVLAGTIWYIYLFVANPPGLPLPGVVLSQLTYTFSPENADRWWFIWLAALPFALAAVGAAYLCRLARTRTVAMLLLAVLVILAASALWLTDWSLAIFVALPIGWGWRCVHGA
jgi:hypothetical protein